MDVGTGAIASLLPKLGLLNERYKLQASIRKDVASLSHEMEYIHAALRMVGTVPRNQLDQQTKLWAAAVRKLSYDMEVVVDQLLGTPNSQGFKGLMENMGSLLKKGKTRHQIIATAVKDMELQVRAVVEQRGGYKVLETSYAAVTSNNPPLVAPYTRAESDLVGIHGKKDQELINLLLDGDNASNRELKIVSVVGSGGLGKTTLVKAVYDKIQMGFDCKAFVPVGRNAHAKKVFMDMISQLTMNNSHSNTSTLDEPQLINKLGEILENKRYLIVIDDIWDRSLWQRIMRALYDKNNLGSRIITTTRITSVSRACCWSASDSVYQLEPLSDDDSKKLLYERIFPHESGCPHELEQVSTDILKKCAGVPLAIIAMASVLAGDLWMKPKDELHMLFKSIGRGLRNECWENMQRILSLSYYMLPSHLKSCLLYLSTFPVTHPIERERLVKKLIAEGIIIVTGQHYSLEDLSSSYLNELVDRNVIHPLECNNDGEVISYHIHPMMHDILKVIAMEEKFAASLDDKNISSMNVPHLSIDCPDSENLINLVSSMAFGCGARSLTVFGHANGSLLCHFEGIRLLDLEGCKSIERADLEYICNMVLLKQLWLTKTQITKLPPQIGNLQYLEGLYVGGTQITELPPQIGNLKYLEGLDVGGTQITELPPQIGKLQRLKRLDVGVTQITKLPPQIGNLKYLEGLDVGGTQITELPPQIGKLQRLKTLDVGGTQITKLPQQIGNLQCLEKLDVGGTQITELPPQIFKLQHLKTLDARKSRVKEIPDQVVRLERLVHLLIGDNESCEGVTLPYGIGKMTSLQQFCTIDLRKCSSSSLEELAELPNLKEIAVVSSDEPEGTKINSDLLSSLDKSTKLRSLVVYSDFRLSALQSSSAYKYLDCRKKLTVVRSLKVPIGFAGQQFLRTLDIRVCKLEEDDLKILRELPRLHSLSVRLEVLPTKMICISCQGFAKLESFYVDCRMPRVIFEEGAMPKLKHLELKVYAGSASSEEHIGIKHLLNLQTVLLRYSKWYATNKGVMEITYAVKTGAKEHQNEITLCIAEEGTGGKCTMMTEIFQENKHASKMVYSQRRRHTRGDLHQSGRAIASCSRTSEIEEVVE